jgi:hypothetical protein
MVGISSPRGKKRGNSGKHEESGAYEKVSSTTGSMRGTSFPTDLGRPM